jgi:hypothetical protein
MRWIWECADSLECPHIHGRMRNNRGREMLEMVRRPRHHRNRHGQEKRADPALKRIRDLPTQKGNSMPVCH